jgi:uncharacterized repeat protein (TIGR02543 family)
VLPAGAALEDVAQWRFQGEKTGGSQTSLTKSFADPESETLYLETGVWDFTLEGYNETPLLILKGTLTQTISLGGPNTLEFTVAPIAEGDVTGTVTITINLPAEHGIDQVKVYRDSQELTPESPITPVRNQIVFTTDHAVGDYYFSFRLYKDGDLYGVVSELVGVRQNLISEGTYTLRKEDLNLCYVITYEMDDGEFEDGDPSYYYYRYTDADFTLPEPVWSGHEFAGWHTDGEFSKGSVTQIGQGSTGDKTFWAKWKRGVSVHITLQPQPEEHPALSNKSICVDGEAEFSAAGEYTAWRWFWDGEAISGATESSYALDAEFKTPGVHELSVEVSAEGGQTLSARCRVTIYAEGDPE